MNDHPMQDTSERVLTFLRKTIDQDIQLDTPLIDSGLLDSFHVVELISFVERDFGLRLDPSDVSHDDLRDPRNVIAMVERLRSR
jgi:acyl carrier protein